MDDNIFNAREFLEALDDLLPLGLERALTPDRGSDRWRPATLEDLRSLDCAFLAPALAPSGGMAFNAEILIVVGREDVSDQQWHWRREDTTIDPDREPEWWSVVSDLAEWHACDGDTRRGFDGEGNYYEPGGYGPEGRGLTVADFLILTA